MGRFMEGENFDAGITRFDKIIAEAKAALQDAQDAVRRPVATQYQRVVQAGHLIEHARAIRRLSLGVETGLITIDPDFNLHGSPLVAPDQNEGWKPHRDVLRAIAKVAGLKYDPSARLDDALAPGDALREQPLRDAARAWVRHRLDKLCNADTAYRALAAQQRQLAEEETQLAEGYTLDRALNDAEYRVESSERQRALLLALRQLGNTEAEAKKQAAKVRALLRRVGDGEIEITLD